MATLSMQSYMQMASCSEHQQLALIDWIVLVNKTLMTLTMCCCAVQVFSYTHLEPMKWITGSIMTLALYKNYMLWQSYTNCPSTVCKHSITIRVLLDYITPLPTLLSGFECNPIFRAHRAAGSGGSVLANTVSLYTVDIFTCCRKWRTTHSQCYTTKGAIIYLLRTTTP